MIWHHLLTRDLLEACETTVRHGWEVDALLEDGGGATSRLHVAEVIARSAAAKGLALPPEDGALLFVLRFYTTPTWDGGTILALGDGRLGYNVGDGRVIESTGRALTLLREPGDRYTTGYRIPGTSHL